jgi:hypothetical protein
VPAFRKFTAIGFPAVGVVLPVQNVYGVAAVFVVSHKFRSDALRSTNPLVCADGLSSNKPMFVAVMLIVPV